MAHHNHYLFSDHYLNEILPGYNEWAVDTQKTLEEISELYNNAKDLLPGSNEAQTEERFIRPVLRLLGHVFDLQPPVETPFGTKAPDYAFFLEDSHIKKARKFKGKKEFFHEALAIGDAKYWDRPLDKRLAGGDPFDNNNPNFQIDSYLRHTDKRWGILTNGRLWRLYNRETSYRLDSYYQIDLIQLLESGEPEVFKYFFLFFRKEAFLPIYPEKKTFLDLVYSESIDYARRVGKGLKENVYESLKTLATGYLDMKSNGLSADKDLEEIRANSLVLLYRLLFILYAEARNLLPMDNPTYKGTYSLESIKKEVKEKIEGGVALAPDATLYWDRLENLFHLINQGSPGLGVPAYNGGLFKPENHPFLEKYAIGDSFLVKVIDSLSRSLGKDGRSRVFLDYRDLDARDLGSIYEGLLEYRLRQAQEDLVVTKKNTYVPLGQEDSKVQGLKGERVKKGELYLVTDKGERKATGSYYTPEYIVNYIVENTLVPLVERIKQGIKKRCEELEEKFKTSRGSNREVYKKELEEVRTSFDDEVLKLKVLDPAMGSGHFLVRATEFLAEHIATNPYAHDIAAPEGETAINYWKRKVVEHCIYGVDLNPLAVELAKLSLWLKTVAKGKPLSFLDHHLCCGNSLIGAEVKNMGVPPELKGSRLKGSKKKISQVEQLPLLDESAFRQDIGLAVGDMLLIEQRPTDTIQDVEEKTRILAHLDETRRDKYRQIANLWTSAYFGNEIDVPVYRDAVNHLQGKGTAMTPPKDIASSLAMAQELAKEKFFFHWELEFPEVFFDQYGRPLESPGFDAVIGNPPWGAKFSEQEKGYYRKKFRNVIVRMIDSYMYFIKEGLNLTQKDGFESLIVPNPFLIQIDVWRLRKLLLEDTQIRNLINFGDGVFGSELANPSCLFVVQKTQEETKDKILVADLRGVVPTLKEQMVFAGNLPFLLIDQTSYIKAHNFSFLTKGFEVAELISKLRRSEPPLLQYIKGEIQRGISADFAPAFIVDERFVRDNNLETAVLRPIITGHNVSRFNLEYYNEYIVYLTREDSIDLYPNIKNYLEKFRKSITCVEVQEGKHPWYALHRPRDANIFKSPKLVGLTTSDRLILSVDTSNYYAMDNLYIMQLKNTSLKTHYHLLALLNSSLLTCIYRHFAQEEKRVLPQVKAENLYQLPIRRIGFVTAEKERKRLVEEAKGMYYQGLKVQGFNGFKGLLGFVGERLEKRHKSDPQLIEKHNEDPINKNWQIPKDTPWEQSDVVHDLLAFLAEQIIEMNKEKQVEIKGFLEWLERQCKAKIDELKNKTKIKNYHEHSFQEILDVITDNARKLQVEINREFEERLKSEFEKSLIKLSPLKEKIEKSDWLIDQIVYRLYGLTEEEIRVVEKKD